jgi:hypothetical protein
MTGLLAAPLLAAWLVAAANEEQPLDRPTISLSETYEGPSSAMTLLPLRGGFLALVAADGRLQFRSQAGLWSDVMKLPVDHILQIAIDDSGVLLSGNKEGGPHHPWLTQVFLVGTDGQVTETWGIDPQSVRSLATRKGSRWATSDSTLLALLPGGKYEAGPEIPKANRDGRTISTRNARLYFGREGECVYCIPEICEHDGPCHYAYCYRQDQVNWVEFGRWTKHPILCGNYLLEPEGWKYLEDHLPHHHQGTVVRRIADGVEVASVKMDRRSVVACGGDDEFLIADTSIKAFHLTTGRRLWSVPVRAGTAVAVARTGDCVIALTNRGKQQNVCREPILSPNPNTSGQSQGVSHGRNP